LSGRTPSANRCWADDTRGCYAGGMRNTAAVLIAILVLASRGDARVVCEKRSGVLTVREACTRKEKPVDLGALGVVGPAGAPGPQGPPGPGQVLGTFTEALDGTLATPLLTIPDVAGLTFDCFADPVGANGVTVHVARTSGAPMWATSPPYYSVPGNEPMFFQLNALVDVVTINVSPSTTVTVWSVIQPSVGNCRLSAQALVGQ
jgi:hypothetical protein